MWSKKLKRSTPKKSLCDFFEALKKILDAIALYVQKHSNLKMLFLDEIEQYPKVCVVAGDEEREYQPGGFKWRFLNITIRAYVHNAEDAQEELALLLEDIEKIIDESDALVYDDTVDPNLTATSMVVETISTDEGVIQPLGIGEISITVRY